MYNITELKTPNFLCNNKRVIRYRYDTRVFKFDYDIFIRKIKYQNTIAPD